MLLTENASNAPRHTASYLLMNCGYFSKVMCLREKSKQRTSLNLMKSNNLLHLSKEHVSCIWRAGPSIALFFPRFTHHVALSYCLCLSWVGVIPNILPSSHASSNEGRQQIHVATYHPSNEHGQVVQKLKRSAFARITALGRNSMAGLHNKLQKAESAFSFSTTLPVTHAAFGITDAFALFFYIYRNSTLKKMSPINTLKCHRAWKSKLIKL